MSEILNNTERKLLNLDKTADSVFVAEDTEVKAETKMRVAYPIYTKETQEVSASQMTEKFPVKKEESEKQTNILIEQDTLEGYYNYHVSSETEVNTSEEHIPYVKSDMPDFISFEVSHRGFLPKTVSVPKNLLFSNNSTAPAVSKSKIDTDSNTDTDNIKFCKYCGKSVDADGMFCSYCGKPIRNGQSNTFLSNAKNTILSKKVVVPDNPPKTLKYRTRLIKSLQKTIHDNDVECFRKLWVSPKNRNLTAVLAALGLFGLGGLNRLYTGKYISGAIAFLFTPFGIVLSLYDLYCLLCDKATDAQGRYILSCGSVLTESERAALLNERQLRREKEFNVLNQLMLEDDGNYTNLM